MDDHRLTTYRDHSRSKALLNRRFPVSSTSPISPQNPFGCMAVVKKPARQYLISGRRSQRDTKKPVAIRAYLSLTRRRKTYLSNHLLPCYALSANGTVRALLISRLKTTTIEM